ncbi:TRAP transporter small permease [Virgibacillus senegalensis]|uniref:TRAP transporter small permease n=1 Tax=Virgibacillus senegalensis TaxID=1499679 RepID=UPI00069F1713|nr:TRAP transporter small permease [Virgibacillus senegalensis]
MKILKWIDAHLEELLLVLISSVMVSVIFVQVIMRIFGNSLSWSEELGRYCFIWLIYLGISYGVKKQRHIKVDVVLMLLKNKARIALNILANLLFLTFALFVVYYGKDIAVKLLEYGQQSPALHIPMGLVYMATPIGFGLTALRLIQNIIQEFLALLNRGRYRVASEYERLQEDSQQKVQGE